MVKKSNKLLFGVGTNDLDYSVAIHEKINGKHKIVWTCPYYVRWVRMLERCYSEDYQLRKPTYVGCYTCPEWHLLSNFRAWMITQDWEGKELDKDILFRGNKEYSPDTCVFVERELNLFLGERTAKRGKYPIGVSVHNSKTHPFLAQGNSVITGKSERIGTFDTPEEAHEAWLAFKLEQAYFLASKQTDSRIAKALIDRYENYTN